MSAFLKNRQPMMRKLGILLTAAAVLSGCAQGAAVMPTPGVTLAPPTPAGMDELPPEPARAPADEGDCNRTGSLRPFNNKAEADAAVATIRNLARDIFGSPSQVEYRILSSADRVAALQNNQVDVVVKTMTITCERKKLVGFSTVYLNANQRILAARDSTISQPSDLSGRRVCVAKGTTSLERIQQISPPPIIVGVVTWADCLVALQQRQVDAVSTDDSILAGLVSQDPYLHIVGPSLNEEPYGIGVNLQNTGLVRFVNGTLERVRRDGTWNTLYRKWLTVLGPAPAPPVARYTD
ncbi:MAG: glutamate ABC transporter substrate-binding protein [Mycobacterium sp.]|nr:glutamate ABC transporter substrate-binding protein [Mycobacterium sp.]